MEVRPLVFLILRFHTEDERSRWEEESEDANHSSQRDPQNNLSFKIVKDVNVKTANSHFKRKAEEEFFLSKDVYLCLQIYVELLKIYITLVVCGKGWDQG